MLPTGDLCETSSFTNFSSFLQGRKLPLFSEIIAKTSGSTWPASTSAPKTSFWPLVRPAGQHTILSQMHAPLTVIREPEGAGGRGRAPVPSPDAQQWAHACSYPHRRLPATCPARPSSTTPQGELRRARLSGNWNPDKAIPGVGNPACGGEATRPDGHILALFIPPMSSM